MGGQLAIEHYQKGKNDQIEPFHVCATITGKNMRQLKFA